jgi:integrase
MKAKISDSLIKTLEPKADTYSIADTQDTGFTIAVRPTGVVSFYLRYRNSEGKQKKYTIGTHGRITVKQARDLVQRLNGQVRNGVDIQADRIKNQQQADALRQQTLLVFMEERYKDYLYTHMKSGKQRASLLEHHFIEPWGNKTLPEINEWLVTGWRKQQLKRGISHAGINRPASALKAMLNRALDWGVIDSNPLAKLKPLREDPSPIVRYLDEQEEKALRGALQARQESQRAERCRYNQWLQSRRHAPLSDLTGEHTDYLLPFTLLALNTGMRRGELFDLRMKDIDLKQKQLTVHGATSKSGKTRHIPLTNEGIFLLTTWCNQNRLTPDSLVFPSPVSGVRFNNINTAWKGLIKAAGIKKFRFHDLRHSYASKLVMRGADLYVIKELLGHASIDTTQRYAHLAPDQKARAVELLNG